MTARAKKTAGAADKAAPTEAAPTETAPAEPAPAETAPAEGAAVVLGVDASTAPDVSAYVLNPDSAFVVCVQSNRAPYTRGGIHFASRRQRVSMPTTTTPDQFRRLAADTAVSFELVHLASGKAVDLPRDLFGPTGEPDFDRLSDLVADLERRVAEAERAA